MIFYSLWTLCTFHGLFLIEIYDFQVKTCYGGSPLLCFHQRFQCRAHFLCDSECISGQFQLSMSLVTNDGANATNLDSQKWMGRKRGLILWNFLPTYPKIWPIFMLFDPKTSWKKPLFGSDFYSQNDRYNVYYSEIITNFQVGKVNSLWATDYGNEKKRPTKVRVSSKRWGHSGVAKCASRHTRPLQKAPTGHAPPGHPSVTAGLFFLSSLWMIPITKAVLRGLDLMKESGGRGATEKKAA